MTSWRTRMDVMMTATVVELLLFLDDCAERQAVNAVALTAEAESVRGQLASLAGDERKLLLHVVAAMYSEADGRSDAQRTAELAGLYHEFARTPLPSGSNAPSAP